MIHTIQIQLDDETGKLAIYGQIETPEQRQNSALVLAQAIQIVLNHKPDKILKPKPLGVVPGAGFNGGNGKAN